MRGGREAEILARTFRDRLTLYRKKRIRDPETDESLEREVPIYEDVLCALSQGSGSVPERQEFYSEQKRSAVIFTPPGIFMEDNDRAVIVTEAGQTYQGKTGRTFGYISHGETPFAPEEMA